MLGFLNRSGKLRSVKSSSQQQKKNDYDDSTLSSSYTQDHDVYHRTPTSYDSGELVFSIRRDLKPFTPAWVGASKAPPVSTFLGKVGSVGLLDGLKWGFVSNPASRGNQISILSFEVANTIVKGSNLMQSLSDENIHILKKELLLSEQVQVLVSTNMKELLSIAAADKREEFEVFYRGVVRFGNKCKDPQWHQLDRFFAGLEDFVTIKQIKEDVEMTMLELANLAQHTSELYNEYIALDRLNQNYLEVESLHLPRKGKSVMILQSELKHQRKLVRNLKKKSLWFISLEKVVEKLVDVVTFIHQAIVEAFGENAASSTMNVKETNKKPVRLGVAGLALHYANLITQIHNIASCPTSLPPNIRDTLYDCLPASVKAGLRSRLHALYSKEVMTMPQIKAEMEKSLLWLAPLATDTTKAHQCFGFVGEWANTGNETAGSNNIIRLQTLYHADKQKMDLYILDLIIWLHRLISLVRYRDKVPKYTPSRSPPTSKGVNLHPYGKLQRIEISSEEKNLLEEVTKRRLLFPGFSKSQELVMVKKKRGQAFASSRSMGSSPR